MARIRTIKPEFFKHEDLAELPAMVRLLFIGLWTQADREGRIEDRPKRLKAEIFPYEEYDLEGGLQVLKKMGFILRYTHNSYSVPIIQICNFTKHQQPNIKEKPSTIPAPCLDGTSITGKGMEKGNGEQERNNSADAQSEPFIHPYQIPEEKPPVAPPPPTPKPQAPRMITMPWETESFNEAWTHWKEYKMQQFKFQYKGLHSEQLALIELSRMSNGIEAYAIRILHHTIANGWKGFVKPKHEFNGQQNSTSEQPAGGYNADHLARMAERRLQNSGTG